MDTLSYKTKSANKGTVTHNWYVVDATGKSLGRLATQIAHVLRGKNKPSYTPHVDCGDYVIVLNSDQVKLTGTKMDTKVYQHYTGYPGGQREINARLLNQKHPTALVENAVKGMLPKNKLGRAMYKKLFVYAGAEHQHGAQKPQELKF